MQIKTLTKKALKILLVDPDKCTGCRQCEKVCSLKHEGECNPVLSRIKVLKDEIMGQYFVTVPVVCQQCEIPTCMEVCPMEAIYEDPTTGARLVDEDRCTGCRMCIISCPVGAAEIHPTKHTSFRCDLCGGDPECVKICLHGALSYIEKDKIGYKGRREAVKKLIRSLKLVAGASPELESD